MAYIIFVNPAILAKAGMDYQAVLLATCLSAGVGTLLMGLLANYPFAQAPGMGLNAFFTFTVVLSMGYTWQQGLAAVFLSGILFIILTVTGLRSAIVEAIPLTIRLAIPAGIGLFIAFIGLNNAGLVRFNQGPILDIIFGTAAFDKGAMAQQVLNAPPQVLETGNFADPAVQLAIIGLAITAILLIRNTKGALFIGIVATTLIGLLMGVTQLPDRYFLDFSASHTAFFQLDFAGLFARNGDVDSWIGVLTVIFSVVISFTLVDLFDTVGTLIGTASKGGFLDKDGRLPRMNRALLADAIATSLGALLGTSTVTTYIESGAGIMVGGRTGLTAVVVALLFFLAILVAPLAGIVPAAATAPALIMVGVMMLGSLRNIDFDNLEEAIPAFMIVALMPFTYSIANGIAGGLIFYTLIKMGKGKFKEVHPVVYLFSALFLIRFWAVG